VTGKAVCVDVTLDDHFHRSARNIAGVRVVASAKLTARDVMDAGRVVLTKSAAARLQEVLA
jgi:ribosomal protein L4